MSLDEYRKKRDFRVTPEPSPGRKKVHRSPIFVVQKHQAARVHYDFRLEMDGVLASWAVPKGPSLNPADKRLAVRTEDHPLEYADFEGDIPDGQYGAGTVMVWDKGTYQAEPGAPPAAQLAKGELKLTLHGEKLKGGFVLLRARLKSASSNNCLLIKRQDEYADRSWNIDPL